jgi:hypothetical protein
VLPYDRSAAARHQGGPLFFPRGFQGAGRHDNPELYGCLYASTEPLSVVVEALAPFRGVGELRASMLTRAGLPLALAQLDLDDGVELLDLDDPAVLVRERLRPSLVATRDRGVTQSQAAALFGRHERAGALSWWSTLEAGWQNLTLFDRVAELVSAIDCRPLALGDSTVAGAADVLGLRIAG